MAKMILLSLTTLLLTVVTEANLDCVNPSCITDANRATLWPFGDANFFLRCEAASSSWNLVRRPCTDRQLFHFGRQRCVIPEEWEEPCEDAELPKCPRIACRSAADQRLLWPSVDSRLFMRCVPRPSGGMDEVTVECDGDTLFSWIRQTCVTADAWRPECKFDNEGEITPTPSTTPDGGPGTTTEPTRGECPVPVCEFQDETLYPHSDWTQFYQCVPDALGRWYPLARPCAANTFFHFGVQRCVYMHEWEDFCLD